MRPRIKYYLGKLRSIEFKKALSIWWRFKIKISISQSNYIPWKGYFHLIALSDLHVVLDSVQYTKSDWRNRNRLLTPSGEAIWLTIPVITANRLTQKICDAEVKDHHWIKKHEMTCQQFLSSRPFFDRHWNSWRDSFEFCNKQTKLSTVNAIWRTQLLEQMNIKTRIISDLNLEPLSNDKNLRVLNICKMLNADEYITGPVADQYLDYELFSNHGINIKIMDYSKYPEYPQNGMFRRHDVSVLDWLSSTGGDEQRQLLEIPPTSSCQKIA